MTDIEMLEKVNVNGPNAHEVWRFLKLSSGHTDPIKWNFSKFLVGRDGKVHCVGLTSTAELTDRIQALIDEPSPV